MPRRKNSNFISVHTSITPENHALLMKAAAMVNTTLGDFLAMAAIDKAHALLTTHEPAPKPAPVTEDQFMDALHVLSLAFKTRNP
jgi:uncharacterized protein (DUF1778 family)